MSDEGFNQSVEDAVRAREKQFLAEQERQESTTLERASILVRPVRQHESDAPADYYQPVTTIDVPVFAGSRGDQILPELQRALVDYLNDHFVNVPGNCVLVQWQNGNVLPIRVRVRSTVQWEIAD